MIKINRTNLLKISTLFNYLRFVLCFFLLNGITSGVYAFGDFESDTIRTDTVLANKFLLKARLLADSARYDSSTFYYIKAARLYEKSKVWNKYIRMYHGVAANYLKSSNPDTALLYSEKGLSVADKYMADNSYEKAKSYFYIASSYHEKANYDKEIQYHNKALIIWNALAGEKNTDINIAHSFHGLGNCYWRKGDYRNALKYYHKSLQLRTKVLGQNHLDVSSSYNNIANCHMEMGNYDEGLEYYKKSLNIRTKLLGYKHFRVAQSYTGIGNCYRIKGNYGQALEYLNKALDTKISVLGDEHSSVAISYHSVGSCHLDLGNYDHALEYFNKAREIWLKLFGEYHHYIAAAYTNIGNCLIAKGDYNLALENLNKALKVRTRISGQDHPVLATIYSNMGTCYILKGNYDRALEYHYKALRIRDKIYGSLHIDVAKSYNGIGNCNLKKGDPNLALDYFNKALNIKIKILGEYHPENAISYNNIGACYRDKGNYRQAIECHQKAIDIQIKTLGHGHPDLADTYVTIGISYTQIGSHDTALEYYAKAMDIYTETMGLDYPEIATVYHNSGYCYNKKGNFELTLKNNKRALEIRRKAFGDRHPLVGLSCGSMGDYHRKRGNYDQALRYYQKALISLSSTFQDTSLTSNPLIYDINSKVTLLTALHAKAEVLFQRYNETHHTADLELSYETGQLAIDLLDSLRFEIISTDSKQELRESVASSSVYGNTVKQAFHLYKQTQNENYLHKAFKIAEKSRAFLLLQGIKDSQAKHFANIPDSLIARENDLKSDIAFFEKNVFEIENKAEEKWTKLDSVRLSMYRDYLFDQNRAFDQLIDLLESDYPQYYKLKYDLNVASVEDIQKKILDKNKAYIEYFTGDSSIYVFSITKDDFKVKKLKKADELETWVTDLKKALSDRDFRDNNSTEAYNMYSENAWKLYEALLSDILSEYDDLPTQITIVPDGVLSYIPFEALLTSQVNEVEDIGAIDYRSLPYLALDHQINYSYSATLSLENMAKKRKQISQKCIAFAPGYDGESGDFVDLDIASVLRSSALSALPGALKEVKLINDYFDVVPYTGQEAYEAQFKKEASKYLITHLAMHGVADNENPLYSKLFFSTVQDSLEDDTLHAYELYNMNILSDLVVLSACETGAGKYARGEGVMSMARAFMYAGSPSVVQTLWNVEDGGSATLMSLFYKALAEGMDKSEALQWSKLRYLELDKEDIFDNHPYYWAGFILNGDTAPLPLERSFNWVFWVMGLGFVIISIRILSRRLGKGNSLSEAA